jgi:hypothetical protein
VAEFAFVGFQTSNFQLTNCLMSLKTFGPWNGDIVTTTFQMRTYGFYNTQGAFRVEKFRELLKNMERMKVYVQEFPRCTSVGLVMSYYDSWSLGDYSYQVEYKSPRANQETFQRAKSTIPKLIKRPFDPPAWTTVLESYLFINQGINHSIFEEDVPHLVIPWDLERAFLQ